MTITAVAKAVHLTNEQVFSYSSLRVLDIRRYYKTHGLRTNSLNIYPIPRGGIPATYALCWAFRQNNIAVGICDHPDQADMFYDDVIDSGATRNRFRELYPTTPFFALVDKSKEFTGQFVVFPWEAGKEASAEDSVRRLLQIAGLEPREGLLDTPKRFATAWNFWTSGYGQEPKDVLKTFKDGKTDEMVFQGGIPVWSLCEHHLAPFFGVAHIGYIPGDSIVGLSKLARLVDVFARRLQVQERCTAEIADALFTEIGAKGVGVVLRCRHTCMESRGVQKAGTITYTSALRGVFKDGAARQEFLQFVATADQKNHVI